MFHVPNVEAKRTDATLSSEIPYWRTYATVSVKRVGNILTLYQPKAISMDTGLCV